MHAASLPQEVLFAVVKVYRPKKFDCLSISVCQRLLSVLVLTRTQSGQHHNASAGDFMNVFSLIRMPPGALRRHDFAVLFCYKCFVVSTVLRVLPLNWMHLLD